MRRRLSNILVAISLFVFVTTSLLWLKRLVPYLSNKHVFATLLVQDLLPRWFGPTAFVGGYNWVKHPFSFWADDGFHVRMHYPRPDAFGPPYLTPEYNEWEKQFRQHDVWLEAWGFHYSYWSMIYSGGSVPSDLKATHFFGYDRDIVIPFWFVLLISSPLPTLWLRRRLQVRRRKKLGLCLFCGYDIRATPDRCPECGHSSMRLLT